MEGPLSSLRVLDLTRLLPGPYATLVLADLGADVVKIEEVEGGDYLRAMPPIVGDGSALFHLLNRNKRSLALDLKQPAGRETFLRLLDRYDVVVESFRPGVLARLGLGYEALRARQKRTILCSISGYGQAGPYAQRAGHDLDYESLSGLLAVDGEARPPAVPAGQIADVGGGAWPALVGLLAAALDRERTGEGSWIDISMTEGCLAFLTLELARWAGESAVPPGDRRDGERSLLGGAFPCYRLYRAKDGRHVALSALEPKFWAKFCEAVGRPDWIAGQWDVGRTVAEVEALFATKGRDAWIELLLPNDCCVEPLLGRGELERHPVHAARGSFFDVEGLGATLRHVRTPVRVGEGLPPRRSPPAHGAHSRELLAELGLAGAEIDALAAKGAIRCTPS
ncbi:MAG: CaiB/BaiF CoA transferase family protein [Deltaproteobacteria bacterium]